MSLPFRFAEAPFLRLLAAFLLGIGPAIYFPVSAVLLNLGLMVCVFALTLAIVQLLRYSGWNLHRCSWVTGISVQLFTLCFGYSYTAFRLGADRSDISTDPVVALLRITSEPVPGPLTVRFEAKFAGIYRRGSWFAEKGLTMVTLLKRDNGQIIRPEYGDRILVSGSFAPVKPALNPKEFDYARHLDRKGIRRQVLLDTDHFRILGHDRNSLIAVSIRLKKQLEKKYEQYVKKNNAAAFLSALILGDRSDLDKETVQAYSNTGTTHVLSVSGMHVGIVFLAVSALLKFMDRRPITVVIRAVLVIGLLLIYAVLTGLSAAVCRAAVMLVFVVIAKAASREIHHLNLLAVSAFILLLIEPSFLADVGFQLSYIAVWALFEIYPLIYVRIRFRNYLADKVWACIAVSIAAQVATFPLSIYYFHQFPVYFLVSNLFIVVPVTLIMYVGVAFLFIPFCAVATYIGRVLEELVGFMNRGLNVIGHWPGALAGDLWPTTAECCLLYLVFFTFLALRSKYVKPALFWISSIVLVLSISFAWKKYKQVGVKELVIFSLPRHTAIGLVDEGQGLLITDLKESDKLYQRSVRPYFSFCGVAGTRIVQFSDTVRTLNTFLTGKFVGMRDKRIMVLDSTYKKSLTSEKINVDLVLLRGNTRARISDIQGLANFRMIVADGSNSRYHIAEWTAEARELGVRFYGEKDKPAFILPL